MIAFGRDVMAAIGGLLSLVLALAFAFVRALSQMRERVTRLETEEELRRIDEARKEGRR